MGKVTLAEIQHDFVNRLLLEGSTLEDAVGCITEGSDINEMLKIGTDYINNLWEQVDTFKECFPDTTRGEE